MANRAFQNYASSGELLELYIGGIQPEHKVQTTVEVTNAINSPKDSILLTPQVSPPSAIEGLNFYDDIHHTRAHYTDVNGFVVHDSIDSIIRVVNKTGVAIPAGKAIRNGGIDATTSEIKAVLAKADLLTTAFVIGFTIEEIPIDGESFVIAGGHVPGIDTSLLSLGVIFLSDTDAGEVVQSPPNIASALGTVKKISDTNGEYFAKIDNLITYPQATGFLRGQNTPLYSLTTTAQDVVDYILDDNIILSVDKLLGTITVPLNGRYDITFTAVASFTSTTSTRTVYFELYNETLSAIEGAFPSNIPRDATEDGISFTAPFKAIKDHVYKIRVRSSVAMNFTFDNAAFIMTSHHLST